MNADGLAVKKTAKCVARDFFECRRPRTGEGARGVSNPTRTSGFTSGRSGGGELALFFGLKAKLAAGGGDVVAFLASQCDGYASGAKDIGELFLARDRWTFPGEAFDGVVGDQIYVRVEVAGDIAKFFGLIERVVDVLDEDELEGDHAAVFLGKLADGGDEFGEGERAVHGHDFFADLVGGAVEGDGEPEAEGLVGELQDFGDEAAGGNGDAAGAEAEAPVGVENSEGADQRVVVGERFAHAHDDDVVEGGEFGASARGEGIFAVADLEELRDDFAGGEIAFEAEQAAGAETAGHGAADLGGDADGFARVIDADAFLRGANDDGFDEGLVAEFEQEFVGDVGGLFIEDELGREEVERLVEPGAERFREIGHLVPGADAFLVEPLEDLLRAERGLAARAEFFRERVEGFAGERRFGGREFHSRRKVAENGLAAKRRKKAQRTDRKNIGESVIHYMTL